MLLTITPNIAPKKQVPNFNITKINPVINTSLITFKGDNKKHSVFIQKLAEKSITVLKKIKSQIPHNVVVISGPSGVGKDTIINAVKEKGHKLESTISDSL